MNMTTGGLPGPVEGQLLAQNGHGQLPCPILQSLFVFIRGLYFCVFPVRVDLIPVEMLL